MFLFFGVTMRLKNISSLSLALCMSTTAFGSQPTGQQAFQPVQTQGDLSSLSHKIEMLSREVAELKRKQHTANKRWEGEKKEESVKELNARTVQQMKPSAPPPASIQASNVVYDRFGTEVRIGGRLKLDVFEDLNGKQSAGNMFGLDTGAILLRRNNADERRGSNMNATAIASRLSAGVNKAFNTLDTLGYIEIDFAGGTSSRTSNSPTPRLRHGFAEIMDKSKDNRFLIGQTTTIFADLEANPVTTNNQYPGFRQLQVRYTRSLAQYVSFLASFERPNTQTYQWMSGANNTAIGTGAYVDNDSATSNSKSALPDFIAKVRYQNGTTLFSLRGVLRRLEAKTLPGANSAINSYSKKITGWGLGVTGMYSIFKPVTIMGQIQGGQGIGRYVDGGLAAGSPSFDSYLQYPTNAAATNVQSYFSALRQINFVGGVTLNWTEKLETTVGASYTKISAPSQRVFLPVDINAMPTINKKLERYWINVIYTIVPKSFVVFEIEYATRKAGYSTSYRGKNTRFTLSYIQNF